MVVGWLETASFLSWVVKDMSWVLLIPETAWVALLCGLFFESWDVRNHWKVSDRYNLAGRFVLLLWLMGNGTWMTSELLYENPQRNIKFPWFHGALLGPRTYVDDTLKAIAGFCWGCALFLGILAQVHGRWHGGEQVKRRLNADLWFIFWVMKDSFWLLELPWNALACSLIIFCCLIELRETTPPNAEPSTMTAAMISWLSGNTVWLVGELLLNDATVLPRAFSFVFLAVAMGMGIKSFCDERCNPEERTILPKTAAPQNYGKM